MIGTAPLGEYCPMNVRSVVPNIISEETADFFVGPLGSDQHYSRQRQLARRIRHLFRRAASATAEHRGRGRDRHPSTDESWGARRFFVTEPNGLMINVMTHY